MAVIMAPKSGGLLGTLGALAGVGGTLFGAPWLGTLGAGMSAADAAMNGQPGAMAQTLANIYNGEYGGMQSPTAGNIAQAEEAAALKQWRDAYMKQQTKQGWGW